MISLGKIAADFHIPEKVAHTILLNKSNQIAYQLLSIKEGKYFVHHEILTQITKSYSDIRAAIKTEKDILTKTSNTIPFKFKPYVYFLLKGNTIVYIGQSKQIAYRIATHMNDKDFDTVACFEELNLFITESINIWHYQPILNKDILNYRTLFKLIVDNTVFDTLPAFTHA